MFSLIKVSRKLAIGEKLAVAVSRGRRPDVVTSVKMNDYKPEVKPVILLSSSMMMLRTITLCVTQEERGLTLHAVNGVLDYAQSI